MQGSALEGALNGRARILGYAVDPVELFFLQVQGSGLVRMPRTVHGQHDHHGLITVLVVSIAVICILWLLYGQVVGTLPSNVRPS